MSSTAYPESQDGPSGEFSGPTAWIRCGLFRMPQSRLIVSRSVRDSSAITSSTARSVKATSVSLLSCNADCTVGERTNFRKRTTFMASGRSYLCHSKRCAALIASAITRSGFMRHEMHAELWRATPHSANPKNTLIRLVQKIIAKTFLNRVVQPPTALARSARSARKVAAIYRRRLSIRWYACILRMAPRRCSSTRCRRTRVRQGRRHDRRRP